MRRGMRRGMRELKGSRSTPAGLELLEVLQEDRDLVPSDLCEGPYRPPIFDRERGGFL
jgi:hypothetical protein